MEKDYLSIKEFAEIVHKTQQSIYKRLSKENNPLKVYAKQDYEGLKIHKDAIKVIYGLYLDEESKDFQPLQPSLIEGEKVENDNKSKNEQETSTMKVITILQEQLEQERKSNEKKDIMISELNERLAESQRMLDQQQKLSMLDKQRILQLEQTTTTNEKRKSIFDFFKRRNEKENETY